MKKLNNTEHHHFLMAEKIILLWIDRLQLHFYLFAQRNQKYIYEVAYKKKECHSLQTFHWHYKAYVYTTDDATHCCSYFSVFICWRMGN